MADERGGRRVRRPIEGSRPGKGSRARETICAAAAAASAANSIRGNMVLVRIRVLVLVLVCAAGPRFELRRERDKAGGSAGRSARWLAPSGQPAAHNGTRGRTKWRIKFFCCPSDRMNRSIFHISLSAAAAAAPALRANPARISIMGAGGRNWIGPSEQQITRPR